MEASGRESAIVVVVELPEALEAIRAAESEDARLGVPAHVTLLYPFVDPASVDDAVLATVRVIVASVPAFEVELAEVRRWGPGRGAREGVLWLAPVPDEPFAALTRALAAAFPDHPPYGGIHDEVVPHLTLATDDGRRFDDLERGARASLPVRRRVDEAVLLLEGADGRWETGERFRLG